MSDAKDPAEAPKEGVSNVQYGEPDQEEEKKAPKVALKSGEEEEEPIFKMRSRLYRFRDGQWKERGTGNCKMLRNAAKKQVRFIMRQEKTFKVVANFLIQDKPMCELGPMPGQDKAFLWTANDFSDEKEGQVEKLALRL